MSNDGSIEIKDSDIAYGFNLGLLYEFSENTRIGLTYRSQVDIEFEDAVSLKGLLPGIPNVPGLANLRQNTDTDIDMYLPQSIMFSAYHKLNHSWSLMGNLGWQDWSEFGNTDFTLNNLNRSIKDERDFDDTWHVALGTHYQWSDSWKLMAGIAYDSSPVSDNKRTIDMPLDRQIRYALGAIIGDSSRSARNAGAAGALIGGIRQNSANNKTQQKTEQWKQKEANNYANNRNQYNRAYTACLEGKGYTVK